MMELRDLVGEHVLTGLDCDVLKDEETYGSLETVAFTLDNITFLAREDPDDGHRSMCSDLEIIENRSMCSDLEIIENRSIRNIFTKVKVICKMKNNERNDVLEVYDFVTNKLIFNIGTDDYNSYYPYFQFEYHPENMTINNGRIKGEENERR